MKKFLEEAKKNGKKITVHTNGGEAYIHVMLRDFDELGIAISYTEATIPTLFPWNSIKDIEILQ